MPEAHDHREVGIDGLTPVGFSLSVGGNSRLQIETGTKRPTFAVDDDGFNGFHGFKLIEREVDFIDHGRIDGVELVGPVEAEQRDGALP